MTANPPVSDRVPDQAEQLANLPIAGTVRKPHIYNPIIQYSQSIALRTLKCIRMRNSGQMQLKRLVNIVNIVNIMTSGCYIILKKWKN